MRYTVTVAGNVWQGGLVVMRTAKVEVIAETEADAAEKAVAHAERLGWGGPAVQRVDEAATR